MPKVSVILPVYNGEKFLKEAINGILAQTFKDFELIIINDGSTDGTQKIIDSYKDKRIFKLKQENKGLVASLNRGIELSKGEYIARHDADDISLPIRLEKQVSYLDSHPGSVLIGTRATEINESGRETGVLDYPNDDAAIRLALFSYTPFAHGSVMYKKEIIKKIGGYTAGAWPAEDYDLWSKLLTLGSAANLKERLYKFRMNSEGISLTNQQKQTAKILEVRRRAFKDLRVILRSPLTVRKALSKTNNQEMRHNAYLLWRVSILRLRPINAIFMMASLMLALPLLLKDN